MPKLIRHWGDLVGLESDKYRLDIELRCRGFIVPKEETQETWDNYWEHHVYLDTQTFSKECYQQATETLQKYGFDVQLETWDKEDGREDTVKVVLDITKEEIEKLHQEVGLPADPNTTDNEEVAVAIHTLIDVAM